MSLDDNMPNFDDMSPDEITAWMESLAKRQGATEGFVTEADVDIPEVDPDSVVIDEPGYIPYGQEEAYKKQQEEEAAAKPPPPPTQPEEPSIVAAPPPLPPPTPVAPPPSIPEPVAEQPQLIPLDSAEDDDLFSSETTIGEPAAADTVSWLENLAASPGEIDLSALTDDIEIDDLEDIDLDMDEIDESIDTVAWLENLTQDQGDGLVQFPESAPPPEDSTQPAAPIPDVESTDTMEWLESLAKRQGASDEELLTEANLEIPLPDDAEIEGPGYREYSFEAEAAEDDPAPIEDATVSAHSADDDLDMADPSDWLDSIASGRTADLMATDETPAVASPSDTEIQSRLSTGEQIDPDEMKAWMERQLDRGLSSDEPDYVGLDDDEALEVVDEADSDEPAIQAELPEWLLEQASNVPVEVDDTPVDEDEIAMAFEDISGTFDVETPEWLQDAGEGDVTEDIDIIFDDDYEPEAILFDDGNEASSGDEIVVDASDPWVEAFDEEHEQGSAVVDEAAPEWYQDNISDPDRIAAVEQMVSEDEQDAALLEDAVLDKESDLPTAQIDAVPDWAEAAEASTPPPAPPAPPVVEPPPPVVETPSPIETPAVVEDAPVAQVADDAAMPDWLVEEAGGELTDHLPEWLIEAGADPEDLSQIPDWLMETLETDEMVDFGIEMPATPEAAAPAPTPAQPAAPSQPPAPPAPAAPRPTPPASPAPIPADLANIDVPAVLANAREKAQGQDIDGSLVEYETLVRANAELGTVVDDLKPLVMTYANNPGLRRVMGDALMRQGRLQEALDTYRSALNML